MVQQSQQQPQQQQEQAQQGEADTDNNGTETTTTETTGKEGDKWHHDLDRAISFRLDNPHRKDSKAWDKYEKAKGSTTVGMAKGMGISAWDLKEWKEKGFLKLETEGDGGIKRSLDFHGTDAAQEEYQEKEIDKIEKLEKVREKLSPAKKKNKKENDVEMGTDYDETISKSTTIPTTIFNPTSNEDGSLNNSAAATFNPQVQQEEQKQE